MSTKTVEIEGDTVDNSGILKLDHNIILTKGLKKYCQAIPLNVIFRL